MKKIKHKKIVKIISTQHEDTWYAKFKGRKFKVLDSHKHHKGMRYGYIYSCTTPGYGWIWSSDCIEVKNNFWNRLFSK